jgi:hypothetical protein
MYWNYSARQFTPRLPVSPAEHCTVNFVFCSEHKQPTSVATPLPPDKLDDDIDPMAEDTDGNEGEEVQLSHFLSPPSPASSAQLEGQLTLSQEILIQEYSQLIDEL